MTLLGELKSLLFFPPTTLQFRRIIAQHWRTKRLLVVNEQMRLQIHQVCPVQVNNSNLGWTKEGSWQAEKSFVACNSLELGFFFVSSQKLHGGELVKTWRSLKSISSHSSRTNSSKWSEKKGEKHFHLAAGTTAFIVIVFPRFSSACVSLACCQIRFLILCWLLYCGNSFFMLLCEPRMGWSNTLVERYKCPELMVSGPTSMAMAMCIFMCRLVSFR